MLHHFVLAAYQLTATPAPGKIDTPLQHLLNLLIATGLILAGIGFVLGGGMTAIGGRTGNVVVGSAGKSWMLHAAGAAALIAGATAIINWAWGLGLLI